MIIEKVVINYHQRPNLEIGTKDDEDSSNAIMNITQIDDVGKVIGKITLIHEELSEIIELAKLFNWDI